MADKVRCPKCGTENYATDPMCLNCGASLREPPKPAPQEEAPAPAAAVPAGPAKAAKAEPKPKTGWAALNPFVRALVVAVVFSMVEMLIVNFFFNKNHRPPGMMGVHFTSLGFAMQVVLWGLIFGVLRAGLIGGLIHLTGWGPTVGLVAGLALGLTGLGTWYVGMVVGFVIGLGYEGHEPLMKTMG